MDKQNFRVVFTIKEIILAEYQVQEAKIIRISIDNQSISAEIPLQNSIVFDVNIFDLVPRIQLSIENNKGHLIASGEQPLPDQIHKNQEFELKTLLTLDAIDNESSSIQLDVVILFINKNMIKDQQAKLNIKLTGGASPTKSAKSKVHTPLTGQYSPARSVSPTKLSARGSTPSKGKKETKEKDQFEAYLQKLVDKHTNEVMGIVQDHQEINETIALNKRLGNLVDANLQSNRYAVVERTESYESKVELDRGKLSVVWDDIGTPIIRKGNQEKESDLSTDKQKQRYMDDDELNKSTISNGSPNKRRSADGGSDTKSESEKKWESAQVDYLKKIIVSLEIKCKELDAIRQENETLKEHLRTTEEHQQELRLSIEETAKELKLENDVNRDQIQKLLEERSSFCDRIRELGYKNDEAAATIRKAETQKSKLEGELQEAQNECKRRADVFNQLSLIQNKMLDSEKQCNDQVLFTMKKFEDAAKQAENSKKAFNEILKENERLNNELTEARRNLAQEKRTTYDLNNQITILNQKLDYHSGMEQLIDTQKTQREDALAQLKEAHANNSALNKKIDELRAQVQAAARNKEAFEKLHSDEVLQLNKKIQQYDDKTNSLVGDINQHLKTISDLKSKIAMLEQVVCTRDDLNKQLDNTKQRLSKALSDRDQALENVKRLATTFQEKESEKLDLHRTIKDLSVQIKERDEYIISLRRTILEIREGNPLYIPVKEDPVDNALADYINSLTDPGKVKVLFMREGEGVYQFGSKKIYVKSEGDKIQIRVGGGFINIEDFLEQNVTQELSKLAAKDPVKALQKNVQLHKTLAGRCVNQISKTTTAAYSYKPVALARNGSETKF